MLPYPGQHSRDGSILVSISCAEESADQQPCVHQGCVNVFAVTRPGEAKIDCVPGVQDQGQDRSQWVELLPEYAVPRMPKAGPVSMVSQSIEEQSPLTFEPSRLQRGVPSPAQAPSDASLGSPSPRNRHFAHMDFAVLAVPKVQFLHQGRAAGAHDRRGEQRFLQQPGRRSGREDCSLPWRHVSVGWFIRRCRLGRL